jgi:hypothetical protein
MTMTPKQELLFELGLLLAALDWPPISEKKAKRMAHGVVESNIKWARAELKKLQF